MNIKRRLINQIDKQLLLRSQTRVPYADETTLRRFISSFCPRDVGHELIRIGRHGDGGYLVPNDLNGISACFSPGVSRISDFEMQLARDYEMRCFLADASVSGPSETHELFDFEKKFLDAETKGQNIRLVDWVDQKVGPAECELLLQMDIEGAEYEVLADTPVDFLKRFRIIVIELHALDDMIIGPCLRYAGPILSKLTRFHTVVHLHPNNFQTQVTARGIRIPRVLELTLLRNDRFSKSSPVKSLPHPLDVPNSPDLPDVMLSEDWYCRDA